MTIDDFDVLVATEEHTRFAQAICDEMAESAKARGTGIAKRTADYVSRKMREGKAVIAFHKDGTWAGFSYIESWGHGGYVANSGLIINPKFRKLACESDQDQDVLLVAEEVPGLETVRPDDRSGGDEDQLRAGLPARHLFGADRRRPVLGWLPELRQLPDPAEQAA